MSSLNDPDTQTQPGATWGLETSSPCVERHVANARRIADHVTVVSL